MLIGFLIFFTMVTEGLYKLLTFHLIYILFIRGVTFSSSGAGTFSLKNPFWFCFYFCSVCGPRPTLLANVLQPSLPEMSDTPDTDGEQYANRLAFVGRARPTETSRNIVLSRTVITRRTKDGRKCPTTQLRQRGRDGVLSPSMMTRGQ